MVKLDKIYTRAGDQGKTRLSTGAPIEKWDLRVTAYGTVDEVNSVLGLAALHAERDMLAAIRRIQNDLFDLGADLATPDLGQGFEWEPLRIVDKQVVRLEQEIDKMNAELPLLDSFVLPGGTPLASYFHLGRTTSRRAERLIAELAAKPDEIVSQAALSYANRLSDWLFVASRYVNDKGDGDIKWVPGDNR